MDQQPVEFSSTSEDNALIEEAIQPALARAHIFFDELGQVKLVHSDVADAADRLRVMCADYTKQLDEYMQETRSHTSVILEAADRVNSLQMRLTRARNAGSTANKTDEQEYYKLKREIAVKQQELAKLQQHTQFLRNQQIQLQDQFNGFSMHGDAVAMRDGRLGG